jgi:SNF2 family DNA or RNA helicase
MAKPPKNTGIVIDASPRNASVEFDSGEKHIFALPSEVLERQLFEPGDSVQLRSSDLIGVVKRRVNDNPLAIYEVSLPNNQQPKIDESGLRLPVILDPLELLRRGEIHSARSTNLRITAARLLFDHKFNEFSSLSNSRVEIKSHQVAVLHRVATSYPHRFLLADEVGLGKTIEAGMIIKELKARGLADRVLIVAPSGIVGQWQMEMRSKFGLIFSRYNSETVAYLQNNNPNENVWTLNPNVIVSSTYACNDEKRRREIELAGWDVVIIDEAHHARRTLQSESALKYSETNLYKLAEALAGLDTGATTGLLLLTATPMQLHQFELYTLIDLLDPVLFPDYQDFETNRKESRGLNLLVKQIRGWDTIAQDKKREIVAQAAKWLAQSEENMGSLLSTLAGRSQVEEDLFSQHRLSEVLIRNRKATVGGFMPRVAIIWEVEMTPQEREAYEAVCEYTQSGYADSEKTRDFMLGFLMVTFQKINSSSSYAMRQSLMRRMEKLSKKPINDSITTEIEEEDLEEKHMGNALGNAIAARGHSPLELEINRLARIILLLDSIEVDSKPGFPISN